MVLNNLDECIAVSKVAREILIDMHTIKCLGEIKMMCIANRIQIKQNISFSPGHVKHVSTTAIFSMIG